mgnify:CR=1 FL=1
MEWKSTDVRFNRHYDGRRILETQAVLTTANFFDLFAYGMRCTPFNRINYLI